MKLFTFIYTLTSYLILIYSPFLFLLVSFFFQLYFLYFEKISFRLLSIANFFIALFWYFCFHYYLALLISDNDFKEVGVEVLTLTNPCILTKLVSMSASTESIFRSLFVETCVFLHLLGEKLNLTITVVNIF